MREIIRAILWTFTYNREIGYMIDLCQEVLERVHKFESSNRTYDGDIIYGFLVLLYGDFGTSPRSGWIENENIDRIAEYIDEFIEELKEMETEENEDAEQNFN